MRQYRPCALCVLPARCCRDCHSTKPEVPGRRELFSPLDFIARLPLSDVWNRDRICVLAFEARNRRAEELEREGKKVRRFRQRNQERILPAFADRPAQKFVTTVYGLEVET